MANDFSKLVASDFTIGGNAANHGWLRNIVEEVLDPENDLINRVSRRPDSWLRMRWRVGVIRSAWEQLIGPVVASDWVCEPQPNDTSSKSRSECDELTNLLVSSDGFRPCLEGIADWAFRGYGAVELGGRIGGFGDIEAGEQLIPKAMPVNPFGMTWELETGRPRLLLRTEGDPAHGEDMTQAKWKWKFIYGQFGSTEGGNWFGSGYGLPLFWLYHFLTKSELWWANAMERFGTPIPIASITEGDWETQKNALFAMFRAMQANQDGWAVPKGVDLRFTNEGIHAWPNFMSLDENLQKKIRLTILGVTDTQDGGDTGSFAAVKIRAQQVTPRQAQIANLIQTGGSQLVRKASDYVFGSPRNYRLIPRFDDPIDPDKQRDGVRLAKEIGLEVRTEQIYEIVNLQRPDGTPDTMRLEPPAAPGAVPSSFGPSFAEVAERKPLTKAQRRKDLNADERRSATACFRRAPRSLRPSRKSSWAS